MAAEFKITGLEPALAKMRAVTDAVTRKAVRGSASKAMRVVRDAARANARRIDDPQSAADISKNIAVSTSARAEREKISGWERSKLSAQDHRMLKKMGLLKDEAMQMPGDESFPHPPEGFRVIFTDFLVHGLSIPVHEFLRGLLFIYGIQLHQLTPNSILHISIFITLCECFLGIHPHWGMWKRIFYLCRNNSKNAIYNVGGICIYVRPEAAYFDLKFADSVQGWRKKWLYVKEKSSDAQEYGLAPFDSSEDIQRRKSWDAEATAEEIAATESLIARIQALEH
jgi:hypothetical protein